MRSPAHLVIAAVLAAFAALCCSGCVFVRYEDKDGRKFSYMAPAFGVKTIEEVNLQTGTLKGYRSEQSQMVEAISAGVAAGLNKVR